MDAPLVVLEWVMAQLEDYMDVHDAAAWLHVHPETVRRYMREGKLLAIKFHGKLLVDREEVAAFVPGRHWMHQGGGE